MYLANPITNIGGNAMEREWREGVSWSKRSSSKAMWRGESLFKALLSVA
jgi:hypothetical protein